MTLNGTILAVARLKSLQIDGWSSKIFLYIDESVMLMLRVHICKKTGNKNRSSTRFVSGVAK